MTVEEKIAVYTAVAVVTHCACVLREHRDLFAAEYASMDSERSAIRAIVWPLLESSRQFLAAIEAYADNLADAGKAARMADDMPPESLNG